MHCALLRGIDDHRRWHKNAATAFPMITKTLNCSQEVTREVISDKARTIQTGMIGTGT